MGVRQTGWDGNDRMRWDPLCCLSPVGCLPRCGRLPERNNHPATVSRRASGRVGGVCPSDPLNRHLPCRHHHIDDLPFSGCSTRQAPIVYTDQIMTSIFAYFSAKRERTEWQLNLQLEIMAVTGTEWQLNPFCSWLL